MLLAVVDDVTLASFLMHFINLTRLQNDDYLHVNLKFNFVHTLSALCFFKFGLARYARTTRCSGECKTAERVTQIGSL